MTLEIRGLTKTYPNGVRALNGIDLSIGKGLFGLLGPNGAGKSSLMRTLATLQLPDSGSTYTVVVRARPVRAGIDPYNVLIDRNRRDNVKTVTVVAAPARRAP